MLLVDEISRYFLPLSLSRLERDPKGADLDLTGARAELKEQIELFDQLLAAAAAEIDADRNDFTKVASLVYDKQAADDARLRPLLLKFHSILARKAGSLSSEDLQPIRDGVDLIEEWLTLYSDVHATLLKIASNRRPANQLLRARPLEGEIDYIELSREHMARYPKIRARLAE
jgi:hypothetical protein